jgi:hypothetical protein
MIERGSDLLTQPEKLKKEIVETLVYFKPALDYLRSKK